MGSSSRHHLLAVGWEGVPGDAGQPDVRAGWALTAGDFDGSGRADLTIGAPRYDSGTEVQAGAEVVLYSERKVFSDDFETGSLLRWSSAAP